MLRIVCAALCMAMLAAAGHSDPKAVETSSRRGEMWLNGLWRFMPAVGPAAEAPQGEWGEIPVPGSWSGGQAVPGPKSLGKGRAWGAVKLAEVSRAWYELTVPVPIAWRGRAILFELTRVSTDAEVFANGVDCGRIDWPSGVVDISKAARAGQPVTLRLLVAAVPKASDVARYLAPGNKQTWTQPAHLASRGIVGEARLLSRPSGPHVSDVFVRTSVRKKSISLDVEVSGVQRAGDVRFTARMLDGSGKVEKSFSATKPLAATATQTVTLEWPWANPRLWDVGQPNLYTLQLAASGAGLDDEYPQTFGFREFWIDGLNFFLNGTPIRLRPVCLRDEWTSVAWVPQYISEVLATFSSIGFNLGEQWPNDEDERGSVYLRYLWDDIADRKGFLIAGDALSMNRYIYGPGSQFTWDKPGVKERYERRMAAQLRKIRNHPSIVMWATSANFFGRYQDQAPTVIGRRDWYKHDQKAKAGLEGVALIKRDDPTRPVFTHEGADIGDIHTCNVYLDLLPLQEREDWLSAYVKDAVMPFLPIEFGTPLHTTFMRGRNGFGNAVVSEPLMTEFCAIYLGSEAYKLETAAYRDRLEKTYEGNGRWRNWQNAPQLEQAPACQAVEALFIRNTWRSWRTWGLTAGMVPWEMGQGWQVAPGKEWVPENLPAPTVQRGVYLPQVNKVDFRYLRPAGNWRTYPSGQALIDNDNITLAWIAGPSSDFTAKDHSFYGGETVSKQIVLINDEREAEPWHVTWTAEVGGKRVASGERSGTIDPAHNLFLPIGFEAPVVTAKTDGRITLTATIGPRHHADQFGFRVFPKPAAPLGETVLIFDPEGATTALLKSLGVRTTPWDGKPAPGKLVVVGRHALDGSAKLPGSLEKHVAAGGRLLLFAQSPDWLRRAMGLRVARQVSRRFFPVPSEAANPLIAGLDAEDFRDWRGAGTLVPATAGGPKEVGDADPPYGWHWGNTGSVSSCAVEKPHFSGWRPILEGEFDLAYSPLMELSYGAGHAVFCTLDLAGRTETDPVARLMARRVVTYAAEAKPEPRAKVTVYLGGEKGSALLHAIGLKFQPAMALPDGTGLAVLGSDANVSAANLDAFLRRGGKALLLPHGPGSDPWGAIGKEVSFHGSLDVPAWPECRGLSLSDLHLRGTVDLAPVTAAGGVVPGAGGLLGRRAEGDGVAILLQLTAGMLPTHEKTYLRYSAWRLSRTLTQLLANLGATFEMDARSLSPGWYYTGSPEARRPKGKELLRNADFSSDLEDWSLYTAAPAAATATITSDVPPELAGGRSVKIDVTKTSDTAWHVSFQQQGLAIKAGTTYIWSAWMKASKPATVTCAIEKNHDPYGSAGLWDRLTISTEWKLVSFDFTPTQSDDRVRFSFQEMAGQVATFWFAAPSFSVKPTLPAPRDMADAPTFYSRDFIASHELGDDPYRYYRW